MKLALILLTAVLLAPLATLPASDLPPAGVNARTNLSVAEMGQILLIVPAPAMHILSGGGLFDTTRRSDCKC